MPETLIEPAHLWVPEHRSSSGEDAAGLAESAGIVLDAEQRLALDALLAERPDGRWVAFEAALIAARQNLKTFVFKVIALADIYLFDAELVMWTAHEFNTAMEAFRDIKLILDANPHLSRRVKKINNANGDEGIEFTSGQRLRFKARTKSGGRGLSGDRVILDEAFALQPAHMGSLMPTMSAKSMFGNPQVLYGSSAGQATSDVLRGIRDRGRAGNDPSLVYVEWCAPEGGCAIDGCSHEVGVEGCVLDDEARWQLANPALGRRISVHFVAAERRSLTPQEFARERLGWWDDPIAGGWVIPADVWALCGFEDATFEAVVGAPVFAVDVSPDQKWGSIAVAGVRGDGQLYVELVEHEAGVAWMPERLLALKQSWEAARVIADLAGPAGALDGICRLIGVELEPVTSIEHARACGAIYSAAVERRLVHRLDALLDVALAGAVKADVGDGLWKWSRTSSAVDISPLVAATLAVGAVDAGKSLDWLTLDV